MNNLKLTEWFPATVKPVHEGVYEIRIDYFGTSYATWSKGLWTVSALSRSSAGRQQRPSFQQNKTWRGVSKE
jgi:putative component of toxin-antitoxin plasmid stabilization module